MPSFKNFANGGADDGFTQESTSIRYKQTRDTRVGSRIEKVWATDFEKCESREDYEKYISKYGKYDLNKYVKHAKARIKSLDAEENARVAREEHSHNNQQRIVSPRIGGNGITQKNRFIHTCMRIAVWIAIIGGVGLYSYVQYKQELNDKEIDVEEIQPSQHQDLQEEYTTHTNSEQTQGYENPVVEKEPEQLEFWWDCKICCATGRCQRCWGTCLCNVCGGGGSLYRSSGWIECSNCGGSGRCPACDGSGFCFACKGSGKCKTEI